MNFTFGEYKTEVFISHDIPDLSAELSSSLVVADENTLWIAKKLCGSRDIPLCVIKSGEENKNWQTVETILSAAHKAGLGRDGKIIGAGGGVIGDLSGFAASVYMRGCALLLVSTTLLSMADASVGGKTGFDLFGIKNFAGSFYPARMVYMPLECLSTLPEKEIKSGMAEVIKTAILSGSDTAFMDALLNLSLRSIEDASQRPLRLINSSLQTCIEKAVEYKGKIVTEDPRESGKRMLLNLGHTFGHALEAAAGLGNITHGEAVAWGIVQSCALGLELGITPKDRAQKIKELIKSFGYDFGGRQELASSSSFFDALTSDKKKKQGKLTFIVPDEHGAQIVPVNDDILNIIKNILKGGHSF
jgi:3-dehydroquinate synthase